MLLYSKTGSTKVYLAYPNLVVFATGIMSDRSCAMAVWFAVGRHQMLIICASHKSARSVARSATSSRSRFVEGIIVNSIATATRQVGGQNLDWIRLPPLEHFGWNRILCQRERRES